MIKLFVLATLLFFGLKIWASSPDVSVDDGGAGPKSAADSITRGVSCDGSCHTSASSGMITRDRSEYRQEAKNLNNTDVDKKGPESQPKTVDGKKGDG